MILMIEVKLSTMQRSARNVIMTLYVALVRFVHSYRQVYRVLRMLHSCASELICSCLSERANKVARA